MKVSNPPAHLSAIDPPRRFSPSKSVTQVRTARSVRGPVTVVSSEHRSTHGGIPAVQGERRRVPLERRRELMHLSDAISAQPNRRVKLAAPAPVGLVHPEVQRDTITGVNTSSSRRSLRAFR